MTSSPSTAPNSIKYPSINIIGAGIAGLSLACHLRRRRIPFTIFESASRPKGHNYGITISPWGYTDLLPTLEQKPSIQMFRESTAVDRLVNGYGITTSSNKHSGGNDDIRVSDMALREVLSRGHDIKWNHKVVSAEKKSEGLKLQFEDGSASTANITIDAGGERSGLMALLLPDLKPEILPYAVYHGSRYITAADYHENYHEIFQNGENVRSFPPPPPSSTSSLPSQETWHIELAKSHIPITAAPSKVRETLDTSSPSSTSTEGETPIIELRYTFSRPTHTTTTTTTSSTTTSPTADPLFRPSRAKDEATTIPPEFHTSITTYLTSNSSPSSSSYLPTNFPTIFSAPKLQQDRILNWLLRVKTQPLLLGSSNGETPLLRRLAAQTVLAVGDAVHACPPVRSEGASLAMEDAETMARWIEDEFGTAAATAAESPGQAAMDVDISRAIMRYYLGRRARWQRALDEAKVRVEEIHAPKQDQLRRADGKL